MKNTNKKGFTVIELVIVIAIIAVLAAVLIPTFSSLVEKANQSADVQAVRQMNTALSAGSIPEKPVDFNAVIDILAGDGFNAEDSLTPITTDHSYYWYSKYNVIILVDKNGTVIYPADNSDVVNNFAADKALEGDQQVLFDLKNGYTYVEIEVSTAEDFIVALERGQSVRLTTDVTLNEVIDIPAGADVTVDMGGHTVVTEISDSASNKHHYAYQVLKDGKLTIENGIIKARGVQNRGELIVKNNVTIYALDKDAGACVYNYENAVATIEGGMFYALEKEDALEVGAACLVNAGGTVTVNGGTFTAETDAVYSIINKSGSLTINNATVTSTRGALGVRGGTVIVNDGSFTNTGSTVYAMYADGEGLLTLNGGTLVSSGHDICVKDSAVFTNNTSIQFTQSGIYYDITE